MTEYSEKRNGVISELRESIVITAESQCYDKLVNAEKAAIEAEVDSKLRNIEIDKVTEACKSLSNLKSALTSLQVISGILPEVDYDAEGVVKKIASLGLDGIVKIKKQEKNPAQQTTQN